MGLSTGVTDIVLLPCQVGWFEPDIPSVVLKRTQQEAPEVVWIVSFMPRNHTFAHVMPVCSRHTFSPSAIVQVMSTERFVLGPEVRRPLDTNTSVTDELC